MNKGENNMEEQEKNMLWQTDDSATLEDLLQTDRDASVNANIATDKC